MLRVSGKVNVSGDVKPPRIVGSEDGQLGVCHATKRLKLCFKGENHRVELVSPFTVCNTPDVHVKNGKQGNYTKLKFLYA